MLTLITFAAVILCGLLLHLYIYVGSEKEEIERNKTLEEKRQLFIEKSKNNRDKLRKKAKEKQIC